MASRLRPFGFLFEKSLSDLIRGIRSRRDPDAVQEYLRQVVSECREEVRSPRLDVKATAVLKLAYLEMLGFDMSWAGFHVVEVMASPRFQQKRIGYLAAMQSFRADPELLMLVTNLLKTDLASSNSSLARVALALSGLASVVTPLLAADVSDDVLRMLSHSQPYIRKKAILAMHKVVLQYPESLQACLPRLAEKLDDEDSSVVAAAVNVIGEFAQHSEDPAPFVAMAPQLYTLLLSSTNNWTLIKLLKLFAHFVLYEPRLKTKLLPAIQELLDSKASSLMYECLACILNGGMLEPNDHMLAGKCVTRLRELLEVDDPNLKYVSLQALQKMAQLNTQFIRDPETERAILACVGDTQLLRDPAVRSKLLAVLSTIVNEDNLYDIVTPLLDFLRSDNLYINKPQQELNDTSSSDAGGGLELAGVIIKLCSANNYSYLPQFEWFLNVLLELSQRVPQAGSLIGSQIVNIAVRVKSVRPDVVSCCLSVIHGPVVVGLTTQALWALGEYAADIDISANGGSWQFILRDILTSAEPSAAKVTCCAKLMSHYAQNVVDWEGSKGDILNCLEKLDEFLSDWAKSSDFELQERSCQFLEFFRLAREGIENGGSGRALLTKVLPAFFSGFDMTPLASGSQHRIQPPAGVNLETPIMFTRATTEEIEFDSDGTYESELETDYTGGFEKDGLGTVTQGEYHDLDGDDAEATDVTFANSKVDPSPFYIPSPQDSRDTTSPSPSQETTNSAELVNQMRAKTALGSKRQKPAKIKVEVAGDELIGGLAPEPVPTSRSSHSEHTSSQQKPLFQVGFRSSRSGEIIEADDSVPAAVEPVIVKHKKKKKSKTKTKPSPSESEQNVSTSPNIL